VSWRSVIALVLIATVKGLALAGPTGLNVIPTTDIVQVNSWVGSIQNANTSFTGTSFFKQPMFVADSQFGLENWLEAGIDYAQTPDRSSDTAIFNVKAQVMAEDELQPNLAFGFWNVAQSQKPGYYVTMSKTLNYDQEQEERFRAHHRRNRKLLGCRVHIGMMLDGHGIYQPFAGTDLQLSETAVFQADWVQGAGNAATAGIAYVLPDTRTVLAPALVFSNDTRRFSGILFNISHQFNL
jgi:hypothetical protein